MAVDLAARDERGVRRRGLFGFGGNLGHVHARERHDKLLLLVDDGNDLGGRLHRNGKLLFRRDAIAGTSGTHGGNDAAYQLNRAFGFGILKARKRLGLGPGGNHESLGVFAFRMGQLLPQSLGHKRHGRM